MAKEESKRHHMALQQARQLLMEDCITPEEYKELVSCHQKYIEEVQEREIDSLLRVTNNILGDQKDTNTATPTDDGTGGGGGSGGNGASPPVKTPKGTCLFFSQSGWWQSTV